jgi:hypothetical protein
LKNGVKFGIVAVILVAGLLTASLLTGTITIGNLGTKTSPGGLEQTRSGLAASDPLNKIQSQQQLQSNSSYWQYGGTSDQNSSYYGFFESANDLHIGVSSTNDTAWTGYYAVTPPTNASLVHAVLTSPSNLTSGYYDIGLYMQSSDQLLNYLACVAITTPSGTVWGLVHAQGTTSDDALITPLWVESGSHQPLTQSCTIVTNGANSVTLYLNGARVYQAIDLALNMPAPYSFFVEDESLIPGQIVYGQYQDFYATTAGTLTLTNLPSSASEVVLAGPNNQTILTAPASSGKATINLGNYTYPIAAYVRVYSSTTDLSNTTLVAYTPAVQQIYGGDQFSFGAHPSTTAQLSVQAEDLTGHEINGMYISLTTERNTVSNQFMPWTFNLNNSQTYTLTAYDYGPYTFDHWSDGSTSRVLTLSITQNTNLVAYYRDTNAPAPAGKSLVDITAVSTNGTPITGLTVTLWQNGVLQGVSYTPGSFVVTPGILYAVSVSSYGPYTFSHWSDGVTTQFQYFGAGNQTVQLEAVFDNSTG